MRSTYTNPRDIDHARKMQVALRGRVKLTPLPMARIRLVAGADVAISKRLDRLVAAVVVMRFPELEIVETRVGTARATFPYIPGFLSFREIPVLLDCFRRLASRPDVVLCDGQGIAHPRGLGLASHLGLLLGLPSVGCAKSRLVGEHDAPGAKRGDYARLLLDGRMVGSVLRTRDHVRPMYISPGHRIDHAGARRIVLACGAGYRLPEPTRRADFLAGEEKRRRERGR